MATKFHFCDDCGTRNSADSKFCKECGKKTHVLYQTLTLTADDHVEDAVQQERLTQFLDMAFWHTEAGNTDAAVRACNAALAIHPHSTTAHSLLGSLYEKKGDDAQAIEHFEQVLVLNPDSEADRAKLDQIRSGVHSQPVKPSPLYHWLPPALAHFRIAGWAEKISRMPPPDMTVMPTRPNPALAAGAAAVLVLACGLFMIKPPPRAAATAPPVVAINPTAITHSAFAGPTDENAATRTNALPAPIVLGPARPGTPFLPPGSVSPPVASLPRPDPFADTRPSSLLRAPYPAGATTRPGARTARAHRGGGGLHALPALPLGGQYVAVPPASEGPLPPAPVQVPASIRAATSPYAGVVTHTVVVQRFNGTPSELSPTGTGGAGAVPAGGYAVPAAPPPPTPASHIEITIDRGSDNGSSAPAADNTPSGESYQQTAFSLQQQGDYRHARATYEKAVHAYQAQIAAGRDPEAARRGLEACQTGLQICQQSQ